MLGCKLAANKASCEGITTVIYYSRLYCLCIDINECNDTLLNGCDHNCINLPCQNGRYSCSCDPGYTLHTNNRTCIGYIYCTS